MRLHNASAATAAVRVLAFSATLVALLLAYRSRDWPLIHVPAQMHYMAWLFTQGAVPYRDVFDMNAPGSYLIHIALWRMFGESDVAFRAFDLCWLLATCAMVFVYARRMTNRWCALAGAALFAIYHLADGASQAGERDYLLTLFLLAGMHAVARYLESGGTTAWLYGSGLAFGAAIAIKPPPALMLLAGAMAAGFAARRLSRSAMQAFAVVILFGCIFPALSIAWLWWRGGLAAFIDVYTGYVLPLYGQTGRGSTGAALSFFFYQLVPLLEVGLRGLRSVRFLVALAVVCVVIAGVWFSVNRQRVTLRHGLVFVGLCYGALSFFGQGKIWPYHMYPWLIFFCVTIAIVLESVSLMQGVHTVTRKSRVALVAAVYALLVCGLTLRAVKGTEGLTTHNDIDAVNDLRHVEAMARDLAPLVGPGDTVQQMDPHHMAIHSLLKVRARQPSRFVYEFQFFQNVDDIRIQTLRTEFLSALRANKPAAIVMTPRDHPWLVGFPELTSLIQESYAPAIDRRDYRIYARKDRVAQVRNHQ